MPRQTNQGSSLKVSPRMEIPRLILSDLNVKKMGLPSCHRLCKTLDHGAQWKGEVMTKSFAEDNCCSSLGNIERMAADQILSGLKHRQPLCDSIILRTELRLRMVCTCQMARTQQFPESNLWRANWCQIKTSVAFDGMCPKI